MGLYSIDVDDYSLGKVTLYLVTNFRDEEIEKANDTNIDELLEKKTKLSEDCKDFIKKLITVPELRLNDTQALSHNWLKNVDPEFRRC